MIRRLQRVPLQAWLVVPFLVQLCLAVGVTGGLSWRNGQRAVNQLVLQLQSELGDRVKLKIVNYLEQPVRATQLNAEAAYSGQLSLDRLENAESLLFDRLQQFDSISGVLLANTEGDARAVNRRDGLNLISRDQQQDSRRITEYRLNEAGERQALRQTFAAPDVRQSSWYRSAIEAGDLVWSPVFQTGDHPNLSLNASMPVYDSEAQLLGVVSSGIVLSVISEFLASLEISPNGVVFIVDRDGSLVASSSRQQPVYKAWPSLTTQPTRNFPRLERIQARQASDPLIREAAEYVLDTHTLTLERLEQTKLEQTRLEQTKPEQAQLEQAQLKQAQLEQAQAESGRFRGSNGRNFVRIVPYQDEFGMDWRVIVVVPEQDFMAQINRNTRMTLGLSSLALLGSLGFGLLTARWLSRSILRLSQMSEAIANDALDPRAQSANEDSPIKEISRVAQSVNQMSAQLRASLAGLETQVEERTLQLQQAFDFEETLKRLTDKVRDSLDEEQILQTAVEELAVAIGVRGCNAALYDLKQQHSVVKYEYTQFPQGFQGRRLQMQNFAGYPQLLQGQHFQHCGLILAPSRGRVAMLSCPIQDDQGVLGDLWLIKSASEAFEEREIRLVQQVANQCAIALRQARLYQAAQVQVMELERLNRLKDDFLSTVSHELRTPIANMKMALQMLEIGLTQQGVLDQAAQSPVQRYFEILKDECQRESRLINNLLDLSRLASDTQPLSPQELPYPTAWLNQIAQPYLKQAEAKHQQFQIQIEERLPPFYADLSALEQMLTELLSNACKYSPENAEITLVARLSQQDVREVEFQVRNSGVEIPPSEQERVFERFYRIPSHDPWKHGGTGLGLALVQGLSERLGGCVELWSQQDQTCFTLRLAIALPTAPEPRAEIFRQSECTTPGQRGNSSPYCSESRQKLL